MNLTRNYQDWISLNWTHFEQRIKNWKAWTNNCGKRLPTRNRSCPSTTPKGRSNIHRRSSHWSRSLWMRVVELHVHEPTLLFPVQNASRWKKTSTPSSRTMKSSCKCFKTFSTKARTKRESIRSSWKTELASAGSMRKWLGRSGNIKNACSLRWISWYHSTSHLATRKSWRRARTIRNLLASGLSSSSLLRKLERTCTSSQTWSARWVSSCRIKSIRNASNFWRRFAPRRKNWQRYHQTWQAPTVV